MKYKGTYRLKPNLDQFTNDFPRTDDESIDQSYDDIYIKCANGSQIYHYGHSTLVAYIPSIGRAHNIIIAIAKELKLINEDTESRDYEILYSKLNNNGTIFDIHEYDSEVEFGECVHQICPILFHERLVQAILGLKGSLHSWSDGLFAGKWSTWDKMHDEESYGQHNPNRKNSKQNSFNNVA